MVRFMTYVTLLTLAVVAVTSPVSANPDPAEVAREAGEDNSPDEYIETEEETTKTEPPIVHNVGAISDSISNVTVETVIDTTSNSTSGGSNSDDSAPSPAPAPAPVASASTHVTPSIVLASVAAIVIINLFV